MEEIKIEGSPDFAQADCAQSIEVDSEVDGSTPMHEALEGGRLSPIDLARVLSEYNF